MGPGMDMVDADMDVDTTEDTTDIHTDTDTDTTVERDLLMPNQKQKLPLIQVPGTDMVDTTATHTDTVVTTAVDTTGVRFLNYLIHLQYHRKISNTALLTT